MTNDDVNDDVNDEFMDVEEAPIPDDHPVELGNVVMADVTNIADFGVFVRCRNGEEGLIHISEVANEFVTNINKYPPLPPPFPLLVKVVDIELSVDGSGNQ